jgi:hypothetical protein
MAHHSFLRFGRRAAREAANFLEGIITMRPQILIRLIAAAATTVILAASASAQYGPALAAPPAPGAAFTVPTQAESAKQYAHNGHLATAARGFVMQSTGQYWLSNCPNGANCNNGSGSASADLGFFFGPSKSSFAPCGPRVLPDCGGMGCGGGGCGGLGCGKCRTPIFGRGPCGPWPQCTYDSYLNH